MTRQKKTPIPPDGYVYHGNLFADLDSDEPLWRLLIRANLWALYPLGIAIVFLWLPYQLYIVLGTPLALFSNPTWSRSVLWLVGLTVVVSSMLIHELLHALAIKMVGYRPLLSIQQGYLSASIDKECYLTRRQYLVVSLAAVATMLPPGIVALLILPSAFGRMILIALLLNAAASIGDLSVAIRVRRLPESARFGVAEDHISVFVPEDALLLENG